MPSSRTLAIVSERFRFRATVWLWSGDSAWHFVSLPDDIADDVEARSLGSTRGFGSVRVEVRSGDVTWRTSLFPDKKSGTYLLPLKKQVRQSLGCQAGSTIEIALRIVGD